MKNNNKFNSMEEVKRSFRNSKINHPCHSEGLMPVRISMTNEEFDISHRCLNASAKRMKKINEYGRSMIEMLGVLAIIGVLSVGGISGYSKAMYKLKMNKTIDIFTRVLAEFQEFTSKRLDNGELEMFSYDLDSGTINYGLADFLDSLKDICQDREYVDVDGVEACPMPIGEISVWFETYDYIKPKYNSNFHGAVSVTFYGADKVQDCVDFISKDWVNAVPQDWWHPSGGISIISENANTEIYNPNHNEYTEYKPSYSMSDVASHCGNCADSEYCQIYIYLNEDI